MNLKLKLFIAYVLFMAQWYMLRMIVYSLGFWVSIIRNHMWDEIADLLRNPFNHKSPSVDYASDGEAEITHILEMLLSWFTDKKGETNVPLVDLVLGSTFEYAQIRPRVSNKPSHVKAQPINIRRYGNKISVNGTDPQPIQFNRLNVSSLRGN